MAKSKVESRTLSIKEFEKQLGLKTKGWNKAETYGQSSIFPIGNYTAIPCDLIIQEAKFPKKDKAGNPTSGVDKVLSLQIQWEVLHADDKAIEGKKYFGQRFIFNEKGMPWIKGLCCTLSGEDEAGDAKWAFGVLTEFKESAPSCDIEVTHFETKKKVTLAKEHILAINEEESEGEGEQAEEAEEEEAEAEAEFEVGDVVKVTYNEEEVEGEIVAIDLSEKTADVDLPDETELIEFSFEVLEAVLNEE